MHETDKMHTSLHPRLLVHARTTRNRKLIKGIQLIFKLQSSVGESKKQDANRFKMSFMSFIGLVSFLRLCRAIAADDNLFLTSLRFGFSVRRHSTTDEESSKRRTHEIILYPCSWCLLSFSLSWRFCLFFWAFLTRVDTRGIMLSSHRETRKMSAQILFTWW